MGPYLETELMSYISEDTYVYCEVMTDWKRAKDVPELAPYFARQQASRVGQDIGHRVEQKSKTNTMLIIVALVAVALLAVVLTLYFTKDSQNSTTNVNSGSPQVVAGGNSVAVAENVMPEEEVPHKLKVKNANNSGVVLRTGPNENSKLTGNGHAHFFTGDVLLCEGVSGDYYKVRHDGSNYYIPKKYADPYEGSQGPSEGAYQTIQEETVYYSSVRIKNANNSGVVLRTQPNEGSKLTGPSYPHFFTGDVLSCVGTFGSYYEVCYDGYYYYIPKKYADPY